MIARSPSRGSTGRTSRTSGFLALEFSDEGERPKIDQGAILSFENVHEQLQQGHEVTGRVDGTGYTFRHQLSDRQVQMVLDGGLIRQLAEQEG